jgi:hypothetical protein
MTREQLLESLSRAPQKYRGVKMLQDHARGRKLTLKGAVLAKCTECMAYWLDGKQDCGMDLCPLYPWQPFRKTVDATNRGVPEKS